MSVVLIKAFKAPIIVSEWKREQIIQKRFHRTLESIHGGIFPIKWVATSISLESDVTDNDDASKEEAICVNTNADVVVKVHIGFD